jgi:lipopolysaccharide transport system permease protein
MGESRVTTMLRLGWLLFLRDFRYRYRQAYLGYLWPVTRVLFTAVPLILVGAHFNLGGARDTRSYVVFAMAGLVLWNVFWDSVMYPQLIGRRLRKTFVDTVFPREALLAAAGCYVLFNAAIYLPILGITFAVTRTVPPPTVVFGLASLPALIVAGLSLGAVVVPLSLVYLDFRFALPFLSSFLLWTAPIFYEPTGSGLLRTVNAWNPLTYLIDIPRGWIVEGWSAGDVVFLACLAAFLGLLRLSLVFYRWSMPIAIQYLARE